MYLDDINARKKQFQESIKDKLNKNIPLTDYEVANYVLDEKDKEVLNLFDMKLKGEYVPGFELKDFLATPQAKVLIPKVVVGAMRKAADPVYLASNFYKKIKLKTGQAIMFPSIGVMRAYDVAEGQEIPEDSIDWQRHKGTFITTNKCGVRIQFTEEVLQETEFDIVGLMTSEAGRAMARHSEQKAFAEWSAHSWKVFDNSIRDKYPEAGTTGVDFDNNLNDTMSVDDFLDLIIAVYNNEYTPSDIIMHPLAWTTFAKNGLTGSFSHQYENASTKEQPNSSFQIGPSSIQGRIPFAFNVNLSPFCPIDKDNKTFDIFCLDKNNVGVKIVKNELKTEEFTDPARDLRNLKITESYGYGTYNEGRAVCSAKNISMAKSWPVADRVINIK